MALTATMFHFMVELSDVDRSVYEALDFRVARHPSESMRYMLTRTLAYCLEYEEGIAFSKAGISSEELEPPIAIRDMTGQLKAWIDIGAPSADRLHKASKAAPRVALYSHVELGLLRKEAGSRPIHRASDIALWRVEPGFLDELEGKIDRNTKLSLLRTDGALYVTVGDKTVEGTITREVLVPEE
jgi:uncharacterized protein YaeQ